MAQGQVADALALHTIGLDIRRRGVRNHIQTTASCLLQGGRAYGPHREPMIRSVSRHF